MLSPSRIRIRAFAMSLFFNALNPHSRFRDFDSVTLKLRPSRIRMPQIKRRSPARNFGTNPLNAGTNITRNAINLDAVLQQPPPLMKLTPSMLQTGE